MNVDGTQNIMYVIKTHDESAMRYRDLNVFDTNQQLLAARMAQVDAGRFAIGVEDQEAQYPVQIDPLLNEGYLDDSAERPGHVLVAMTSKRHPGPRGP